MSVPRSRRSRPLEAVIAAMGNTANRAQLLNKGYSDWDLRQALDTGTIRRISRGVYALVDSSLREQHFAINRSELTCFERAKDEGLWVLHTQEIPHVATAHGRPVPGCVTHRHKGTLRLRDILRHCAQCGTDLEILCVLESAVVKDKCTMVQLRKLFSRRKDGRIRKIIDSIDPQSMSIAETCARYHLKAAGYNVQGQAHIPQMGHLDALVEGQLGIEIDGKDYHNNEKAWREDLRRGNVLVIKNLPTLRFRAAVAMYFPDEMLSWVRQAMETIGAARR